MLIGNRKTTIAYRCPHCGGGVLGISADVSLAGGRILKLKCPCGESDMTVSEAKDGKIHLTLPCLLCNTEHRYLVAPSLFYGRELFCLNCAYSGLDIAFSGEEARVSHALEENEKTLRRLFDEAGISSLSLTPRDEDEKKRILPDAEVVDVVRFLVRELEADGQVDCPCHNGEYDIEITEEGVRVFCLNCGGEHFFPVYSVESARALLELDRLTLDEPKG